MPSSAPAPFSGGLVVGVEEFAAHLGILPGDEILEVNGHVVRDVLDVQFYGAEPFVEILLRREGEQILLGDERMEGELLGIEFSHATFDTDIRRCNNRCLFCFVHQMPPRSLGLRRSLYVKDDDYRYSFLEGNYVTLTNLSEEDWQRLEEQRLSPLYVSVHSTDHDLRCHLLGNRHAPDVMVQLRRLADIGIEVHTQLVIIPGLNDDEELDRSIQDLAQLYPSVCTISVVPVGLTRFHPGDLVTNTKQDAAKLLEQVTQWQQRFLQQYDERLVYPTDEWYLLAQSDVPDYGEEIHEALQENGVGLVRLFLDDWSELTAPISMNSDMPQEITLVTGTLFEPVLRHVGAEFQLQTGSSLRVVSIVNRFFGDTVTVAGLLTAQDVITQLKGQDIGDLIVLPQVMMRGPDETSLDGYNLESIEAELDCRTIAVENMSQLVQTLLD